MIPAFSATLFAHIVDAGGAGEALRAALRTDRRGRPQKGNPRTFLILLLLAAAEGELTIERMHHIATRELPRDVQIALETVRPDGDDWADMPIDELYYISRTITKKLSWTGPRAEHLTEEQKQTRRHALRDINDRLITATLPERPGASYALDESGIWAWAKGRKRRRNQQAAAAADPGAGGDQRADGGGADGDRGDRAGGGGDRAGGGGETGGEPVVRVRPLSACPDASWGLKTGKDGQQDSYFGYALHALVRIPDLRPGPSFTDTDDPILVEAIDLTPASTDIVDVSLELLDRVRERQPVRDLASDRHYSYKEASRWAHELWARGIHPVLDLREDEHGFRDYDGARIAASWPHCPATPTRLATIPRPGPGSAPQTKTVFRERIAERQVYAMRRVKSHIPDGVSRWECPARAGKLGCPLVEGTVHVAREMELPVVARPPGEDARPRCCTQRTFMIRIDAPPDEETPRERRDREALAKAMKHAQDEYWGDPRWTTSYNRRTHVEGAFGNLKNPNTENVHRGLFRFTGLPLVTLSIAAAVTASNLRQLRNWHARTDNGDPANPLLAPEPVFRGFVMLPAVAQDLPDEVDLPIAA